ncbi:zinc finger protein draculin-like [Mercenaria mercenaria]|uniref:zinc finger protein draculin-like n=1 Tax=Mercenaria mercenaria TaxID=6596 RepID=UPI00234E849D|nr:zinc finger protein draculin-like [Mercenaria mercenaria]
MPNIETSRGDLIDFDISDKSSCPKSQHPPVEEEPDYLEQSEEIDQCPSYARAFRENTKTGKKSAINSQTSSRTRRAIRTPEHLKDYICVVKMNTQQLYHDHDERSQYTCDTCGKSYSSKSNVKKHIHEKHNKYLEYYACTEKCDGRFVRRSYLSQHLKKHHGLSDTKSKRRSRRVRKVSRSADNYYIDISDGESFF